MTDPAPLDAGAHTYSVSLPQFEGPLDLLLHLCQKHELDILDIPIGFITKKYLEYLAVLKLVNLDIAAEYLVMAATLAHIKSKMLLPTPPPGQEDEVQEEEEEDPREALIKRLLEYQKYKLASQELEAKGIAAQNVFLRGGAIEQEENPGLPPLAQIPLFRLIEAFQGVLAKSKIKITHDIVADRISITDRIHELTAVLEQKPRCMFEELFEGLTSKFDLVITFLALLEMTRLRMTRLYQTDTHSPLYVEYTAAAGDPLPEGLEPSSWMPKPAAPAEPQAPAAPPSQAAMAPDDDAPAEAPADAAPAAAPAEYAGADEDTRDTLLDPLPEAPPAAPSAAAEPLVSLEGGHVPAVSGEGDAPHDGSVSEEGSASDLGSASDDASSVSSREASTLPDEDVVLRVEGVASADEASPEEILASDEAVASDDAEGALPSASDAEESLPPTNDAEGALPSASDAEESLPPTDDAGGALPSTSDAEEILPSTNDPEETPSTNDPEETPSTNDPEEILPSTNDPEETPSTNDPEETPSTNDPEEILPSTNDAEETPSTNDAEETPSTNDAEETPSTNDAEETPSTRDAEETPSTRDAEEVPSIKQEPTPSSEGSTSPEPSGDAPEDSVARFNEAPAPSNEADEILPSTNEDAEIFAPSEKLLAPSEETLAPSNDGPTPSDEGDASPEPNVAPTEPVDLPAEPAVESLGGGAAPVPALDAPAGAPAMPRFDVVSPLEAELVASLVRDVEGPASETGPAEAPAHDTDASAADEKSST